MSIPLSLSGKVALISGGSRGIGAATVRLFAAADAKVAFGYRSARSQADALAKECGPNVFPIASDLNNPEAARFLVAKAVERFGRLDILIANHGVWPVEDVPIERMSDELRRDPSRPVTVSNITSWPVPVSIKGKTSFFKYKDKFNQLDYQGTNANQGDFDLSHNQPGGQPMMAR